MKGRITLVITAAIGGFVLANLAPCLPHNLRNMLSRSGTPAQPLPSATTKVGEEPKQANEQGVVKLSDDSAAAAGIVAAEVREGTLARRIIVPGSVVPHGDRLAHVSVKLPSIVAE